MCNVGAVMILCVWSRARVDLMLVRGPHTCSIAAPHVLLHVLWPRRIIDPLLLLLHKREHVVSVQSQADEAPITPATRPQRLRQFVHVRIITAGRPD